nr:MAG TPA: hypothetical protein [Caudoviricetes sp.]
MAFLHHGESFFSMTYLLFLLVIPNICWYTNSAFY